jgi:hypothetical protein
MVHRHRCPTAITRGPPVDAQLRMSQGVTVRCYDKADNLRVARLR